MRLEFEVYGEKLISRQLLRIADRTVDFTPVWGSVADFIRGGETDLFDTQGASSGRPWEQIQPATIARKIAQDLDPRILHATHRLRDSLTEGHGDTPGNADQVLITTPSAIAFGSNVPYAGRHQNPKDGGTQRRPLDFNETGKQHIVKQLQAYALRGEIMP